MLLLTCTCTNKNDHNKGLTDPKLIFGKYTLLARVLDTSYTIEDEFDPENPDGYATGQSIDILIIDDVACNGNKCRKGEIIRGIFSNGGDTVIVGKPKVGDAVGHRLGDYASIWEKIDLAELEGQDESSETSIITPIPIDFAVTNLTILPTEVEPEETVTISVTVTNSGGSTGTHTVVLKVNGTELATKSVTLDAGESQKISFTTTTPYSGTYKVDVNGLEGTFTVTEGQYLFLEIVSVTSPIGKGNTATLRAKTIPGADCTITVYYKSGPSSASGLYSKKADSGGSVSWSWKVGTRTTSGSWRIVVTASLDGDTVSQTTNFTVY